NAATAPQVVGPLQITRINHDPATFAHKVRRESARGVARSHDPDTLVVTIHLTGGMQLPCAGGRRAAHRCRRVGEVRERSRTTYRASGPSESTSMSGG